MTRFFNLTPGTDNFTGVSNDYNAFQLDAATLQSTDTVTGGATGSFFDVILVTAAGTISASQFAGVTNIEQINLSSAGGTVSLSNGLVAGTSTGFFTILDGGGDDTVNASAVSTTPVVFYAAGGADAFTGGGGNDSFVFATSDLTSADAVQGGGGTDNLYFSSAGTVAAPAFTNVSGIEGIGLSSLGNNITLTNSLVAGSGSGSFAVSDGAGNDTVDASGVTNGGTIAFFASVGNDTFRGGNGTNGYVFTAADLTSADLVQGGSGIDNLFISTPGTVGASAFTQVTNIEALVLANGTNSVMLTNGLVAGTSIGYFAVAGGSGNDTVDASGVTNGTALAFYGTTGGNDAFTGGNGTDSFLFTAGSLTAADFVAGGGGNDTLWMTTAGTTTTAALANVTGMEGVFLQAGGTFNLANGITTAASFAAVGSGAVDTFDASAVTGYKVTFTGNGGADVLKGGSQDDTFFIADSAFSTIDGNGGIDRITLTAASQSFNLTANAAKVSDLEVIDLNSSLNSTLTLAGTDIAQINSAGNSLYVVGDADDTVNAGNGWTQIDSGVVNNAVAPGHTFFEYQHSTGSLLFIDTAITSLTATSGSGSTSVAEGFAAGATAFNAQQSGATNYVLGGADAALFNIDGTGHISFKASPDFEAPLDSGANNIYDLTVTSSNGTATPNFVEDVHITVTDVNDNSPVFTSGATASTPENVATTTPVYTAHANDADAGSTVSYALASGGDNALFDINSTTGAVTFKASPDFENPQDAGHNNVYDISVIASDGVPAHNTAKAVAITVTDQNDAPTITSNGGGDAASVGVNENSTAVTTVIATDPDVPAQTFTYSVLTGAGSPDGTKFTIDGSGHLSFISAPNFEAPGSAASSNTYTVQVQVADSGVPTAHDIQTITVNVQDVNDVAPTFTSTATPTATENSTAVVTLTTTDPDTVGTNPASFTVTGGADMLLFTITAGNQLVFTGPRDYETQAHSYAVEVTASDGVNTTMQSITVALADANDNAPIFFSDTTASTPENVATNVAVYTALAPDADGTAPNNTVHYSLASGGDNDLFKIDADTGAVTFKNSPDFETALDNGGDNVYDISVTASDGVAAHDTTQSVAITVTDQNDIAPAFGSPTGSATVNEATSTGTVVFDANATDGDGTPANNTITYSLGGADALRFIINPGTGEVTFAAVPNYEAPADAGGDNQYDITVTASDGVPAHDATQSVTITVADLAPVFDTPADGNPAANEVSNGAIAGASTGVDADATDPATGAVTYALLDSLGNPADAGGRFTINSSSGVVTVSGTTPIVFDTSPTPTNDYTISVRASDANGLFTTHDFLITVVPNNAPVANDDAASATEAGGLNNAVAGTDPSGNVITATGPGDVADTDPDAGDTVTVVAAGTGTEAAPIGAGTVGTPFSGQHGSLLINTDGSYTYTVNQSDAAVQGLRQSTDILTDSFNYTIQDNGGLQDTATLTFTIHGANDNPIANADAVVAVEAGGVADGTPGTDPAGNVITGTGSAGTTADSDPDSPTNGELVTVVGVATGTQTGPLSGNVGGAGLVGANGYGTLTIGSDGTYSYVVDNTNTAVQALRLSNQTLTDTFSYTISDAAGVKSTTTMTVTIDGANDAPVAHADALSATEAGGVSNATAGSNPSGNVITGTGSAGAVADTDADSSANGELLSVVGLATGTQTGPLSGNVGGAGLVGANGYGTLTIGSDGTYNYVVDNTNAAVQGLHLSTDTLTDTFSYTLSDAAGATSTTTVTITIHGANDLPLAVADTASMTEDDTPKTVDVRINDTLDPDSAATNTVAPGAVTITGTPAGTVFANTDATATAVDSNHQIQVTLGAAFQQLRASETATVNVPYTLTGDAADTSSATLTVTVSGANDTPTAVDDSGSMTEDQSGQTFTVLTGPGADTLDPDHGAANNVTTTGTITNLVAPSGESIDAGDITVTANGSNQLVVNLGADFQHLKQGESATFDVDYTLHGDQPGDVSTAHLHVTVNGVNDAPTANNVTFSGANSANYNTDLVVNDPTDAAPTTTGPFKGITASLLSLSGASDADGPNSPLQFVAGTFATTDGGSVTIQADGDFVFTPKVGDANVSDSFSFTVTDGSSPTEGAVTKTATINFNGPHIWYVNSATGSDSTGDGSSERPFASLVKLNGVGNNGSTSGDVDSAGDIIYLENGTYASGITLENNEKLISRSQGLIVPDGAGGAVTVTLDSPSGSNAVINGAVVLGSDNSISGITFGNTGSPSTFALSGTNFGTLNIDHSAVNTNNNGMSLTNGAFGAGAAFTSFSSGGATDVSLTNVTGSIDLGTGTMAGLFAINGGSVNTTYSGDLSQATNAAMVSVTGGHSGIVTFQTGTLSATNGTGLQFDNADGTYHFNGTTTLNGGTAGVNITNGSGGTFTFGTGASIGTNSAGVDFNVNTGTANVTYSGTMAHTAAGQRLIVVQDTTGGLVNFNNANANALTDSGNGILIDGAKGNVTLNNASLTGSTGIEILGDSASTTTGTLTFNNVAITTAAGATNHDFIVNGDRDGAGAALATANAVTGTIDLNNVDITNGGGNLVNIQGLGGSGSIDFDSASVLTRSDNGLGIVASSNSGGTIVFNGQTQLTTAGNTAVSLANNTGNTINFNSGGNGLDISTTTGTGFSASGGGTIVVQGSGNSLAATTGTLLNLSGVTVGNGNANGVRFESASSNGAANGILLDTVAQGATSTGIDINGGSIANATTRGVDINATSADISIASSISTSSAGRSVEVGSTTGNKTIAFSGAIDDNGQGINLTTNTGTTMNFTGALDIDAAAGQTGFNATGGGTVTATNTTNSIVTTTGTALNIANTTIGVGNVTFHDISANGAVNGISLNNTGASGSLIVTGDGTVVTDGTNSTGGIIQNTTGVGISLTSTLSPSFTNMRVLNTTGHGVGGTDVTNFTFNYGRIDGSHTDALSTSEESNIGFYVNETNSTRNNLDGTVSIVGNLLTNAQFHGVDIFNFSGTIDNATISNNTITSSTSNATSQGSGIRLVAFGSATTVANITKATINANDINNFPGGAGILVKGGNGNLAGPSTGFVGHVGSATDVINITSNDVSGLSAANRLATFGISFDINGRGQGNVNIDGNSIANTIGNGVNVGSFGFANTFAKINNNTLDLHNSAAAAGIGAGTSQVLSNTETPTLTVYIDNNTTHNVDGNGILVTARDAAGTVNAHITNNHIDAPLSGNRNGIRVDSGNGISTDETLNLEIFGNTSAGTVGGLSREGIGLRKQGTVAGTNEFNIYDAPGGADLPTNPANQQVMDFVQALNPGSFTDPGTGESVLIISGSGFQERTAAVPMLAALGGVASASNASGEMNLTQAQLDTILAAAIGQWAAAGASEAQLAALHATTVSVGHLSGAAIGEQTAGQIVIDDDAAGHGWFVDPTPNDNAEFTHTANAGGTDLYTDPSNDAAGHLDLLTAVTHELGHVLGLDDETDASNAHDLMFIDLVDGERRLPDAADVVQADGITAAEAAEAAVPLSAQAPVSAPIVVGTAGNDTIDAGHGGNILFGGAGADKFVFGAATALDAPTPAQVTHVADYHAAEGDTFDFSAITSAFHNSNVNDSLVVRAVEDASGRFATLQVDHIDPTGLPSAPNWVNVAQLDGAHVGDAVNVLIDNHSVHLAQIHVDLLV